MAKKKKQQDKSKCVEYTRLNSAFFELEHLESYLHECSTSCDVTADPTLALFLVRAAREKIDYFTEKYNLQVAKDDLFYLEDYGDFIRKTVKTLGAEA